MLTTVTALQTQKQLTRKMKGFIVRETTEVERSLSVSKQEEEIWFYGYLNGIINDLIIKWNHLNDAI